MTFKFHICLRSSGQQKKASWPLFRDGAQLPLVQSPFEEALYFLPISPKKFLVLTLWTSER